MTPSHLQKNSLLPADTLPTDSMAQTASYGLVLISDRPAAEIEPHHTSSYGTSWIMTGLFLLFAIICLRLRGNKRYIHTLISDLLDVRERHNAFDDTVRETSLLVLLNVMWSCCAGVLLFYTLIFLYTPGNSFGPTPAMSESAAGIGICIATAAAYTIFMTIAYTLVGNVFSDPAHTKIWVKGYAAQQGLTTALLFPLALLALCYSSQMKVILIVAAITFIIGKLIFIYKGFRIFFNQFSSWMLFLYYLCSLEIVPLILTYVLSMALCSYIRA